MYLHGAGNVARQSHTFLRLQTPPPQTKHKSEILSNSGDFWRGEGLLMGFCLSNFCLDAFSSTGHVFLPHLEERPRSRREESTVGQNGPWGHRASYILAPPMTNCPRKVTIPSVSSSLTSRKPQDLPHWVFVWIKGVIMHEGLEQRMAHKTLHKCYLSP